MLFFFRYYCYVMRHKFVVSLFCFCSNSVLLFEGFFFCFSKYYHMLGSFHNNSLVMYCLVIQRNPSCLYTLPDQQTTQKNSTTQQYSTINYSYSIFQQLLFTLLLLFKFFLFILILNSLLHTYYSYYTAKLLCEDKAYVDVHLNEEEKTASKLKLKPK